MQATIHNEFLTLTVDTHGAEAVSLKNAAGEEMLWQADPAVWKRHAPILFPWTGKLPGGTFEVDGKTYKGGQHGFARDMEHTLLKAEGDTIQLELRSDDAIKAERFPFDFVLTSTFRLDGKTVHHTLAVSNPGSGELRFGIGYHPAFNIPFDDQHTTTDYEFRFDRPESPVILDTRPNGLLSGRCYYQWKNQQAIQLTDDLFDNDSFCMAGLRTGTIGICEKDTGRKITCNVEGYPYSLIWSAPAKPVRFVCIEPWHSLPAAETDPQAWSQRAAAACLAPGESWETTLSTTFERYNSLSLASLASDDGRSSANKKKLPEHRNAPGAFVLLSKGKLSTPRPSRPWSWRACRSRGTHRSGAPAQRACSGWTDRLLPSSSFRRQGRRTTWS